MDIFDYVEANWKDKDEPAVFVLGSFAHGEIDQRDVVLTLPLGVVQADYVDEQISFSKYPLSGSVACGKLCCAFEKLWGIL